MLYQKPKFCLNIKDDEKRKIWEFFLLPDNLGRTNLVDNLGFDIYLLTFGKKSLQLRSKNNIKFCTKHCPKRSANGNQVYSTIFN